MFVGQYEHNLDEKGRLTIPARYREELENGAYITQGFDKNAMVLTSTYFEQLYHEVKKRSLTDPTTLLFRRVMFTNAFQVDVDKAGRILVPQILRDENGLEGSLVVAGVGDWFEIWSQPCWAEQKAKMRDTATNQQRFAAMEFTIPE